MLLNISNKYKSPNFDNRRKNTKIKYIIIHYTETKNLKTALKILCDPKKKVSCHFIIDLNGKIYKLVDESKNAWHAGLSYWKKNERLNDRSIGIEIVNDGMTKFNAIQIRNLILLLKNLVKNFGIDKLNILGHSDIAPLLTVPGVKDILLLAFMARQAMLLSQLYTCVGSMLGTQPLPCPAAAGPKSFLLKALMERNGPNIELLRNSESLQTLRSQN